MAGRVGENSQLRLLTVAEPSREVPLNRSRDSPAARGAERLPLSEGVASSLLAPLLRFPCRKPTSSLTLLMVTVVVGVVVSIAREKGWEGVARLPAASLTATEKL